jgi:hypothetical protein
MDVKRKPLESTTMPQDRPGSRPTPNRIEPLDRARNARRRVKDRAMRDLGLVKVRGALGGTYWE